MAGDLHEDLPPAKRRWLIARAAIGTLLMTTLLVVLYYQLPLRQQWGGNAAVRVLVALVVFVGIAAWQVRAITRSRYPTVRAIEVLGLILPLYLLVFAATYYVMQRTSPTSFTQPMTRTDALYFSVTVFSTVGFGDIAPRSEVARVVLIFQMLGDLVFLAVGARILLGAVRRGQQRASDTDDEVGPAGVS